MTVITVSSVKAMSWFGLSNNCSLCTVGTQRQKPKFVGDCYSHRNSCGHGSQFDFSRRQRTVTITAGIMHAIRTGKEKSKIDVLLQLSRSPDLSILSNMQGINWPEEQRILILILRLTSKISSRYSRKMECFMQKQIMTK